MTLDRRAILGLGFSLGTATAAAAAERSQMKPVQAAFREAHAASVNALVPNAPHDQTEALQALIDEAAEKGRPLHLPEGVIRAGALSLHPGSVLIGVPGHSVIEFSGGSTFVSADTADGLVLKGIVFDGAFQPWSESGAEALLNIANSKDIVLDAIDIRRSARDGLSLVACSGRVTHSAFRDVMGAGLKSLDAAGLTIANNIVFRCADNGILVWRSEAGEDGTIVTANRIVNIRNASGGTGEYGNAINVFRAGSVLVEANRITDCTYSAIRANAASNIQMIANSCQRLGEVALYAEFGFEGAVIASNIVDTAATGIAVTNFNEGGRLAVVQGNLIRNLFRRDHEAEDKRGEGISIEADAVVSANTIEGAPTVGIQIGWGPYMRDVAATGNVIRGARVGIAVTDDKAAGSCLIANNLISGASAGAIRKMAHGVATGPDLARDPSGAGLVRLAGNVAA